MHEKNHEMAKDSAPIHVLVVEDDALMRWALTETLTEDGYHVVGAASGREATDLLQEGPPFDVVLLDYVLPDSSDLSLLASICREVPHAQVILMTAFGQADTVRNALELGAFSVMFKPFEMQQVPRLVATAYARRSETH